MYKNDKVIRRYSEPFKLNSNEILLEMSLPNIAGILTPIDVFRRGRRDYYVGDASDVR